MTDWRKTSGHPTPPATLLPSAIRPLPSVICHSPFATCHLPSAIPDSLSPLLLLADPRDVRLGIELLACALVAHEPHGAEDRPLGPWAVVLAANRPSNSGVAVGVAAVHLVRNARTVPWDTEHRPNSRRLARGMCLSKKTRPMPRLLNQRTGDSHYHWTKKWGAGHEGVSY